MLLSRGAGFLISMILARLITPEEFGIVALLLLFSGVAGLFVDSGFGAALIQKREHTFDDECTVFWFNLIAGTIAGALLALAAPWIARFYAQPILEPLTWVMAANLWLSAWMVVHNALLTKKLHFRTKMKAGVTATVISGTLAIVLAMDGWGVWALAAQTITATAVNVALLWILHAWRPAWIFSVHSFRRLFRFGGFMLLSGLLDVVASRLYTVLVGKLYSAGDLGFFTRASATKDLPQGVLAGIFSKVAFPVFSAQSHDAVRLREWLRVALVTMMAINLPVMLGLCVTADAVVVTVYGPQWRPAVPILQVLCGVGALWPLQLANLNVLMAQGHSNLFFRLEVIKKSLLVVMVVLASRYSVLAIAWGMFASSIVAFFINSYYTEKFLGYSAWRQLSDIAPYALLASAMAAVIWIGAGFIADQPVILRLMIEVVAGAAIYIGVGRALGLEASHRAGQLLTARSHATGR